MHKVYISQRFFNVLLICSSNATYNIVNENYDLATSKQVVFYFGKQLCKFKERQMFQKNSHPIIG